jgi:hypothetical protein
MPVLGSDRLIRVGSRLIQTDVPVTVLRQRYLDKFVYREQVDNECQIAYVGYEPITFSSSVGVSFPLVNEAGNHSSFDDTKVWRAFAGRYFTLKYKDVWITNKAIRDGQREIPLFFGMKLPSSTINASLGFHHRREADVYWEYDSDAKVIYCSETNYWDPELRDYRAIVVNYTYETEGGDIVARQDLFRSEPVFEEATFLDIDPDTLEIFPGRLVYTTTIRMSGDTDFEVNVDGPIYVAPRTEANIQPRRAGFEDIEEPWHLEFTNGVFNSGDFIYSIREYESQTFYPRSPYRTYWHKADILGKDLLKLPVAGLVVDPDGYLDLDIVIRNKQGTLLKALTTNTTKLDKPFDRWSIGDEDSIFWGSFDYSYDKANSVIRFTEDIVALDTDIIYVQYVVDNNAYVYQDVNLNPSQNLLGANRNYYFYLVPNSIDGDRSIYHFAFEYTATGTQIVESNHHQILTGITTVAKDILGQPVEYFETTYGPMGLIKAATAFFQESFDIEDAVVQDVRLKQLIDFRRQTEVLKKYPWLYFTEKFDSRAYEFPDKFFSIVEVDKENVWEQDEAEYETQIRKHLSPAHTLYQKPGGLQPRVLDIYSIETEQLISRFMPEKPGTTFSLYEMAGGNNIPDPDTDTLIDTVSPPYSTEPFDSEINYTPSEDIVRLYIVSSFGDYTSKPSQVYTVKIR